MKIKNLILIIFLFFFAFHSTAQECKNYHVKKCKPYGKPYKISRQSQSAYMRVGQTAAFNIAAFDGFEYLIHAAGDKNFEGITLNIKTDDKNQEVLFTSSVGKKELLTQEFNVENPQQLIIEIVIEKPDELEVDMDYNEIFGCVGVLIEYYKTGPKGF